jgi:hypothetical protein
MALAAAARHVEPSRPESRRMQAWPERFTYVCAATRFGVVNTIPLMLAGREAIARVVVFVGATEASANDPTTIREALDPLERLRRVIADVDRRIPVETRSGDPGSPAVWEAHMAEILAAATPSCPVVLNIKPGTKEMLIGALKALLRAPPDCGRLITVGDALGVDFLDLHGSAPPQEAPASGGFTLDGYLTSQGYLEAARKRRRRNEGIVLSFRETLSAVAEALLADPDRLIPPINAALPRDRRGNATRGQVAPGRSGTADAQEAARIIAMLGGLPGLRRVEDESGPALFADSDWAAQMVESGWFEAYLFLRLRAAFAEDNRVEVMADVQVTADPREALHENVAHGQFDVALLVSDQLHVIEAKIADARGPTPGKLVEQGIRWKAALLGPHGHFIGVMPRVTEQNAPAGFLDKARNAGLHLALGPDAVERTVAHAADLVARL